MSAAKYTKGPWKIGAPSGSLEPDSLKRYKGKPYREWPRVEARRQDGTTKGVAHVYQGEGGVGSPQALQEQRANALLIAAAPELLDALKAARDLLASLPPEIEQLETMAAEDTACQIQEAIAKAEGGES